MPKVSMSGGFARLVFALVLCLAGLAVGESALARVPFSALSVDARTGKLIYSLDPDGLRHPASLTKMMTLYMLFTELKAGRVKLSTPITISARAAYMAPSKLGVRPGTRISVDTAIRAIVVISANDVATAIAENLGGNESAFAQRMTRTANAIGMTRSNFANASGLPNPNQWTTARDMATLGLRLQRDFPEYYPYFRTMAFSYAGRLTRTHNRLLGRFAGADGIKTGYTAASGFNLTSSALRDGKRVVGVVLGAPGGGIRNAYMMRMLEASFPKCTAGLVIVAKAGSPAGAVAPQEASVAAAKPVQKPALLAKSAAAPQPVKQPAAAEDQTPLPDVNQQQLLTDAATQGGDDSSEDNGSDGATIQTVLADFARPAPNQKPKVIEARLSTGLPAKLPFQVKPEAQQPAADSQVVASLATDPNWQLQVGPFASKADAVKQVQTLQANGPAVLQGKSAFAVTVQAGKLKSFRGRFTGLNEKEARVACQQIIRLKQACQVVAPNS